jgi:endogenous inhibitor of DNA gyrase (YacG/DUF329 family)
MQTPRERLTGLVGTHPVRCRRCRTRFVARLWKFSDIRYTRCPKCLRMDLGIWSESHYRVPAFRSILLQLGGNPYRCEYCRHNFVSFRQRKECFSFNRWRKPKEEQDVEVKAVSGSRTGTVVGRLILKGVKK